MVNRIVAAKLGDALSQQIVVDNRAGAGGTIGVEIGAHAAPDGYTIVVGGPNTMILAKFMFRKLGYDPLKDFDAISLTVIVEAILAHDVITTHRQMRAHLLSARSATSRVAPAWASPALDHNTQK
mgnify:CR=1 FL=1